MPKQSRMGNKGSKHGEGPTPTKKRISKAVSDGPNVEGAFANKDPSCCDVLVLNGGQRFGHPERLAEFLEAIKKDCGDVKATLTSTIVAQEQETSTLTIPGYRLVTMHPRIRWSRMRNLDVDFWRSEAKKSADAFVYVVHVIGSAEDYFESSASQKGWELDRFHLTQFLRSPQLVESPKKPLMLVVQAQEEEELDLERVVNLLGLDNLGRRPFNAVLYTEGEEIILRDVLKYLAAAPSSEEEEESTAVVTASDTDEDGSVGSFTTATSSTVFQLSSLDHYSILDYEPTLQGGNVMLQRFEPIKKNTHCPFARASKLWGGKSPNELTPRLASRVDIYKETSALNAAPLAEFVARCKNGEHLDGFCLQTPGGGYSVDKLGEEVRRILTELANLDPSGENSMTKMGSIDSVAWRFRFAGEDFFITSFSSVYKKDHSRHAFGTHKTFLLFQPFTSFARHGLSEDTPASTTQWNNPTTLRDKARVAFKRAGCPYHIPEALPYPVAEHIVKPMNDDGTTVVRWWEHLSKEK